MGGGRRRGLWPIDAGDNWWSKRVVGRKIRPPAEG
uniref:Uncharacterized protein n=1 Tax=Arundo donax TaxID=35708 RepID=A0A0A9BTV6_ARUDO